MLACERVYTYTHTYTRTRVHLMHTHTEPTRMLRVPRSEHRQVVRGLWPPPHCLLFFPLSTWNPGPFLALGLPFHPLTAPQSPHKTTPLQNLSPTVDMPGIPPSRVVTSCDLELHLGGHLGQTACFKSPGLCRLTGRAAPLAPGWPDHKEKLEDFAPPLGTLQSPGDVATSSLPPTPLLGSVSQPLFASAGPSRRHLCVDFSRTEGSPDRVRWYWQATHLQGRYGCVPQVSFFIFLSFNSIIM